MRRHKRIWQTPVLHRGNAPEDVPTRSIRASPKHKCDVASPPRAVQNKPQNKGTVQHLVISHSPGLSLLLSSSFLPLLPPLLLHPSSEREKVRAEVSKYYHFFLPSSLLFITLSHYSLFHAHYFPFHISYHISFPSFIFSSFLLFSLFHCCFSFTHISLLHIFFIYFLFFIFISAFILFLFFFICLPPKEKEMSQNTYRVLFHFFIFIDYFINILHITILQTC